MGCDVPARLPSGIIFSYTAQVWPPPEGIGPAPDGIRVNCYVLGGLDAASIAALCRPRACLRKPAADDAKSLANCAAGKSE